VPLWFGNQHAPGQENPVYGTARVLAAYADCGRGDDAEAHRGVEFLLSAQNDDGGWGGAHGIASSMEETAVAVSALTRFISATGVREALTRGVDYVLGRVEEGSWTQPAPIGLYFATLWYSEALYPVAWTVEALGRARKALATCDTV
jgi:squalene-hopene/tetraprenyl-beta-curcumene cyclase